MMQYTARTFINRLSKETEEKVHSGLMPWPGFLGIVIGFVLWFGIPDLQSLVSDGLRIILGLWTGLFSFAFLLAQQVILLANNEAAPQIASNVPEIVQFINVHLRAIFFWHLLPHSVEQLQVYMQWAVTFSILSFISGLGLRRVW